MDKMVIKGALFIGLMFLTQLISGQIIYRDTVPDIVFTVHDGPNTTVNGYVNINNDTINDLKFILNGNNMTLNTSVTPVNNSAIIKNSNSSSVVFSNLYDTIGPANLWYGSNLIMNSSYFSMTYGWNNKFIGLRLMINNEYHYGWIRLDEINANNYETIRIRDFAYNSITDQKIVIGDGILPKAENISISDIANNKNGSDIKVNFDKAIDESKVDDYRIILVKAAESLSFSLDSAMNVSFDNYLQVNPNGSNYSDTLPPNMKDSNGDSIQECIQYKAFVLTIGSASYSFQNVLSDPSNMLTLNTPAVAVTNLTTTAIYQGGINYEIKVSFDKVPDESLISTYRVIIIESALTGTFTLDSANAVQLNGYNDVQPTGNDLQINLYSSTLLDYKGMPLQPSINYKSYVLSVANGTIANKNSLSAASGNFNLSSLAIAAHYVIAQDVSNNNNTSDFRISFNKAPDDTAIGQYRVFAVKLSDTTTISVALASSVSSGNYIPIPCTGLNIDTLLPSIANDKDGSPILSHIPYRFYVLSKADSIHTDKDALSGPSNIVTQNNPNYYKVGVDTGSGAHYTNIEPDIELSNNNDYYLDLNNDGINDYLIHKDYLAESHFSSGDGYIQPYNGNSVSVILQSTDDPDTMIFKSMLSQDLFWSNAKCNLYNFYAQYMPPFAWGHSGIWGNINDRYIGLRINDSIYGWIHLNTTNYSITLLDYAWYYQQSVNGITNEYFEPEFEISPNPAHSELRIQFLSRSNKDYLIRISNNLGQIVFSKQSKQNIENINVSTWIKGLYTVEIYSSIGKKTKKLIIE